MGGARMAPPPAAGGAARAGRAAADVQDSDGHVVGGHGRHGAAAELPLDFGHQVEQQHVDADG